MQKPVYLIFIFIILLPGICAAQKEDVRLNVNEPHDSAFIRSYADYMSFELTYGTHNLQYRTIDADKQKFIFTPNEIYETEFAITYSFINLRYSFSPKFLDLNKNENIKGRPERNDFDIGLSLGRFDIGFETCDVKGFYLNNTADFDDTWQPGKPYTLFPNMHIKYVGVSARYNTNPHFSMSGFDGGDEQQLRTAVSFLPTLYVYNFKIKDNEPVIEAGEDEYTKNLDIHAGLPVAANLVFAKNWHCAVEAGPGIGIDISRSTLINAKPEAEQQKQTLLALGYSAKVSLGWSNRRFYAGINGSIRDYAHTDAGNETMEKRFYYASIFAGIRFMPPGFVKHTMDWIKKLLPFNL